MRKETKKHGMQNLIEGWRGPEGSPVVIAEDSGQKRVMSRYNPGVTIATSLGYDF